MFYPSQYLFPYPLRSSSLSKSLYNLVAASHTSTNTNHAEGAEGRSEGKRIYESAHLSRQTKEQRTDKRTTARPTGVHISDFSHFGIVNSNSSQEIDFFTY